PDRILVPPAHVNPKRSEHLVEYLQLGERLQRQEVDRNEIPDLERAMLCILARWLVCDLQDILISGVANSLLSMERVCDVLQSIVVPRCPIEFVLTHSDQLDVCDALQHRHPPRLDS